MAVSNYQTEDRAIEPNRILCLTGPESTGKTAMAEVLSKRLGGRLVPEVARDYLQHRKGYTAEDLLEIARRQVALEAEIVAEGPGLVVCDTDLIVMRVWWEEKYGALSDTLSLLLSRQCARSYLLMSPDLAWEPDALRENAEDRNRLFLRYEALLRADGHRFRTVTGEGDARLSAALEGVRLLFPNLRI